MKNTHVAHILKNKNILEERFRILKEIRNFFWEQKFLEVETPIVGLPGQEPYLSPMSLYIHDEKNEKYRAYLHTSPEYSMKKMLAAGFENIFSICKCFRDNESFGGTHNPEFTMIEWYRVNTDFYKIMDDVEKLINKLDSNVKKFKRVHMRDLWKEYVGIDLDGYLEREKMLELCIERGQKADKEERYEDLFYRIFLNAIEPKLIDPIIIHHYPASMAALAKISEDDSNYAERFEVYLNGMEIANAFTELTDADEQFSRLKEEQDLRGKLGKEVYKIDMDFVDAVGKIPRCSGIALGVDRLVQVLTGCQNIDDVLVLPASKVF